MYGAKITKSSQELRRNPILWPTVSGASLALQHVRVEVEIRLEQIVSRKGLDSHSNSFPIKLHQVITVRPCFSVEPNLLDAADGTLSYTCG